jgi:predicted nucleic acid-binding protein
VIVLDASAAVEWLLQTSTGLQIEKRIYSRNESLHSPHLLDVEVAHVLRRFVLVGRISARRGEEALRDLHALRITRYAHDVLLVRIWQHRQNLSAYDAAYVALAEDLGAPLITRDKRLSLASGHGARIEVF